MREPLSKEVRERLWREVMRYHLPREVEHYISALHDDHEAHAALAAAATSGGEDTDDAA